MPTNLPSGVALERGEGGLEKLVIQTQAASAEVYLHGAHLTRWQPAGHQPVLWMSGKSQFAPGKPIRGGVPICFPWFGPKEGDPQAPAHGLARLAPWEIESLVCDGAGIVTVTLALNSGPRTRPYWPVDFRLRYRMTIGATLTLELGLDGLGSAVAIDEALHTYLAVGDARRVRVTGLEGVTYVDKADGARRMVQGDEPITIAAETDRAYLNTRAARTLHDPVLGRRIRIEKSGSDTTVVWNPWIAKAKAMPDFGDDEWPGMICIETANALDNRLTLSPGARHAMRAVIAVEKG